MNHSIPKLEHQRGCHTWQVGHFYLDLLESGGIPSEIVSLADELGRLGVSSVGFCGAPNSPSDAWNFPVHVLSPSLPQFLLELNSLLDELRRTASLPGVMVVYGAFRPINNLSTLLLSKYGVSYVISPEGIISSRSFASGRNRLAKRLYWKLLDQHTFARAVGVRVLSEFERRELRDMGVSRPMFIAREGVSVNPRLPGYAMSSRSTDSELTFLYMGRLDIWQKGLDVLIEAFSQAMTTTPRVISLRIVGPEGPNTANELQAILDRHPPNVISRVSIEPAVYGVHKTALLSSVDVFIHASRREGVPRVVREALAAGLPVIISPETNLSDIVDEYGAGWIAPPDVDQLCNAIHSAAKDGDLFKKQLASRRIASEQLSWESIARDFKVGIERLVPALSQ